LGYVLILAEKPSQGKAYAGAFKNTSRKDGYIEVDDNRFFNTKAFITWGFGHLVELAAPAQYEDKWNDWTLEHLPILPKQFKFQVSKDKRKQFNVVKKLLAGANEIIVATDPDREGENIARSIIQMAGASKKLTKRLWINSLEVDKIQEGFRDLKNGDNYVSLYKEAQTRQYSDWLVGMNASRLYTLLLQQKGLRGAYSVGRVQTPTLSLIYKRDQQIKEFKPKPFYELNGDITVNNGEFKAKYNDRFDNKKEALDKLIEYGVSKGENKGLISSVEKRLKKSNSPKLHSLSTLQTAANKRWKYSPSDVLKIVQNLYEKKLLSYPRTDTKHITESEFNYVKNNLEAYQKCLGIEIDVVYPHARKRYVDCSKVQEHYAIIPTKQIAELSNLSDKEKNIYVEVVSTTLAMFAGDYQYEETRVDVNVQGLLFHAKGKVEINKGWKTLFNGNNKEKNKKEEPVLPAVSENELCIVYIATKEGTTKPPKAYTEGGLIQVMKRAGKEIENEESKEMLKKVEGIGTEATRASIIEVLKHQKYIEIKKNDVHITEKGQTLCKVIEDTLLASPEMTAKWEEYLSKIGRNEGTQEKFLDTIDRFVLSMIEDAPKTVEKNKEMLKENVQTNMVGNCPSCEDGSVGDKGKFYGCSNYSSGCAFSLPKKWAGKTISKKDIKKLLSDHKTGIIKGFKKKKSGTFDAYLVMNEGKMAMEFPKRIGKKGVS